MLCSGRGIWGCSEVDADNEVVVLLVEAAELCDADVALPDVSKLAEVLVLTGLSVILVPVVVFFSAEVEVEVCLLVAAVLTVLSGFFESVTSSVSAFSAAVVTVRVEDETVSEVVCTGGCELSAFPQDDKKTALKHRHAVRENILSLFRALFKDIFSPPFIVGSCVSHCGTAAHSYYYHTAFCSLCQQILHYSLITVLQRNAAPNSRRTYAKSFSFRAAERALQCKS